ncbi:MAG: hypothetical protein FWH29_09850 [Methanobrevibacter sp.]|nr:hypothetical protein [Methanobrevibacter sp.]
MEISKIISESIKLSNFSKEEDDLKKLLSKLEDSFSLKTLLSKDFWESDDVFGDVARIISEKFDILKSKDKSEDEKVHQISRIIATTTPYLNRAIKDNNLKLLIIFLLTKRREINVIELLKNEKVSKKDCLPIFDSLSNFFQKNLKVGIDVSINSSDSDKKTVELIKKAFTHDNINLFYTEFSSIERGVGYYNYSIDYLLSFMKNCNFDIFLNTLSKIDDIFLIYLFLQNLDENELIKVADSNLKNKWLNVELIRRILNIEKDRLPEESFNAIINSLERVHEKDYTFFKDLIKYFNKTQFNKSNLFNRALGNFLASLPNPKIEEIFNECFEMSKSYLSINYKTTLLNQFGDNADEEKTKFFVSIVFKKYEEFLEMSMKSEDFYHNDLLITDFANFIIHYYDMMLTDKEIVNQLSTLFKSINYIDSEWFISLSQQITKLYFYYSKIYLLSHVYHGRKITSSKVRDSFSDFRNNEIIIHKLSSHNEEKFESSFKKISEKLRL